MILSRRFPLLVVVVVVFVSLLSSCTKEFPRRIAVLTLPIESDIAMAKGQIIDLGETGISDHGFVYDSNASIPANAQRVTLGGSVQTKTFEATLTNLRPHTRYYVNAFLTNSSETTYGDPVSFLTAMNFPEVKTESLANITDSTATCNGEVTQDGGSIVFARGVCWSFTSQPTLLNDHTVDGTGTGKFAGSLIHLKKDSTYFVRAYASNNAGTSYGSELSFKAGQTQTSPTVTTADVVNIAQTTATSGGNVTSDGGASVTARGVCWSTNPYPTIADSKTADGSGIGQFVSSVAGLTANTTYYLRAYATNAIGTSYGDEKTFQTTSNPVLPTVTTASITNITTTTAQSGGTVLENGGLTVTARGVCWSTSSNATISNTHTSDGSGIGSFTSSVTGLTSNTKYYLRAYATNSVGTAYGNEISFTAGQSVTTPTVTTTNVNNITQTTATCGGNVTSDGGATVTVRGVCWSTSTNPTTSNNHTTDGNGTGGYLSSLTGLTTNTSYFVRAYATNSVGTAYGNMVSFTTLVAFNCGSSITINHVAGYVAPVNKTVTYGTATNIPGEPSKCWITSNLGADHQATSVDDATEASAGWYWQFNRKQGYKHDGITRTPNTPMYSVYENFDWQASNDPCVLELGYGWRIPTKTEWGNVDADGNWITWDGPWNSLLKIHAAGYLNTQIQGVPLELRGQRGYYWSSTQYSTEYGAYCLDLEYNNCSIDGNQEKSLGQSLRCIKE